MDNDKIGYVLDPVIPGFLAFQFPVDEIKGNTAQQEVRYNRDVDA